MLRNVIRLLLLIAMLLPICCYAQKKLSAASISKAIFVEPKEKGMIDFVIGVDCADFERRFDTELDTFTLSRADINTLVNAINRAKVDTSFRSIDARYKIYIQFKDKTIAELCTGYTGVFFYNNNYWYSDSREIDVFISSFKR
jgi:hypothetical protein